MHKLIPVQDHENLARDSATGAIIDVDTVAYESYLQQKQHRHGQQARISQLEDRINNIDSDLSDIKSLLTRLLEK
jgi:hypothetical protein